MRAGQAAEELERNAVAPSGTAVGTAVQAGLDNVLAPPPPSATLSGGLPLQHLYWIA